MRLLSWNVNGFRAVMKKGFMEIFSEDPDIICLQETKLSDGQVQINPKGYLQYWNYAAKKGYSGTAVFTKIKPLSYSTSFLDDDEGRVMVLEFKEFFLINVYTPNSQRGLTRLDYRQKWDREFLSFVRHLSKPVAICGDMNVAHKEIDLANPSTNKTTKSRPGNAGFTDQEREGFQRYIDSGFIDTFREFHHEGGNYSWWSYMFNARAKNVGWRIDYFLISPELKKQLKASFILKDVMGSDHCPVGIEIF